MADHDERTGAIDLEHASLESGEQTPREIFQRGSKISLSLAYDLIDKLRYYEKETLKLSETEINERLPHMKEVLDKLRAAYLEVAETEF